MSIGKMEKKEPLISEVKTLIRIPIVNQATDYTCGVAALLSVLFFLDKREDDYEVNLAKILIKKKDDGVISYRMKRFAEEHGFQVLRKEYMTYEELKGFIRQGKPVLLLLQAWPRSKKTPWRRKWEDGHWAVAIGYDAHRIYFMDPSTVGNYTYIPKAEFLARWHDWDGDRRVQRLGVVIWNGRSYDHRLAVKMG